MGEAMKKVDHLVARAFKGAMAFVLAVGLCPVAPAMAQEGATANEEGGTAAAVVDGADASTDGAVAGATGGVAGSEADGVQPGGVSGDADAAADGAGVGASAQDAVEGDGASLASNSEAVNEPFAEEVSPSKGQDAYLPSSDEVDAGWIKSGTCEWQIDSQGCLKIRPRNHQAEGELENWGSVPWGDQAASVKSIKVQGKVFVRNAKSMFAGFSSVEEAYLGGLDTSRVTNMDSMFSQFKIAGELDLSSFDTSSVTSMRYMFYMCEASDINLSSFNVESVSSMKKMFQSSDIKKLDLTSFRAPALLDASSMFDASFHLSEVVFGDFNATNLRTMESMFRQCGSLTELDLSGFGSTSVRTMRGAFWGCDSLKKLNLKGFSSFALSDLDCMCAGCSALEEVDAPNLSSNCISDMDHIFGGCSSLKRVDISGIRTNDQTKCGYAFSGVHSVEVLKVGSNFNLRKFSSSDTTPEAPSTGVYTGKWVNSSTGYSCVTWFNLKGAGTYIWQKELSKYTVTVDETPVVYTGEPQLRTVTSDLEEGEDYERIYENNVNAGNATLKLIGKNACIGQSVSFSFGIEKANPTLEEIPPITCSLGETLKDVSLPKGYSWQSNEMNEVGDVGQRTQLVTFTPEDISNYNEIRDIKVTLNVVKRIRPPAFRVVIPDGGLKYTGAAICPEVASSYFVCGKDYTVQYRDNYQAGKAIAVVVGMGDYSGQNCELKFAIAKAKPEYDSPAPVEAAYGQTLSDVALPEGFSWQDDPSTPVGDAGEHEFLAAFTPGDTSNYEVVRDVPVKVRVTRAVDASMFSVDAAGLVYDGSAHEPAVSSAVVPEGSYTVEYRDNVNAGEAAAVVSGSGFYSGSCELKFAIAKAKPEYEIPSGICGAYGKPLSSVQLPAGYSWQDAPDRPIDWYGDKTLYATYSPADSDNYEAVNAIPVSVFVRRNTVDVPSVESLMYSGEKQTPAITLDSNVEVVTNEGGVDAGSYCVEFALKTPEFDRWSDGSFANKIVTYSIDPLDITEAEVSVGEAYLENGKSEPSVSVSIAGSPLVQSRDYVLAYENNDALGEGIVKIQGKGNYSGAREVPFTILKNPVIAKGSCGQGVTYKIYDSGLMTIDGSGDVSFSGTNPPYSAAAKDVKVVIVDEGITSFCGFAFSGLKKCQAIFFKGNFVSGYGKYFKKEQYAFSGLNDNCRLYRSPGDATWSDRVAGKNCKPWVDGMLDIDWASMTEFGACGDESFWVLSNDGTLSVRGSGAVTDSAYGVQQRSLVSRLVVEDGITSIGDKFTISSYSYSGFENISSVTFADSVEELPAGMLRDCSSLQKIDLPSGIKAIPDKFLYGCTSLGSVQIPDAVTKIGEESFYGCSSLQSVSFGSSVDTIGAESFAKCASLAAISLPKTVASIGEKAFSETGVVELVFPSSVEEMDRSTFDKCPSLTKVVFEGAFPSFKGSSYSGNQIIGIHRANDETWQVRGKYNIGDITWYTENADGSLVEDDYISPRPSKNLEIDGGYSGDMHSGSRNRYAYYFTVDEADLFEINWSVLPSDDSCPHWSFSFTLKSTAGNEGKELDFWYADSKTADDGCRKMSLAPGGYVIEVYGLDSHNSSAGYAGVSVRHQKRDITDASIALGSDSYEYTGTAIAPKPEVYWGETALVEGVDYNLSYQSNVEPGRGMVIIRGLGRYSWSTAYLFFDIVRSAGNYIAFPGHWATGSGGWWYPYDNGGYPANEWCIIDGSYYHFDGSGYMQTGWLNLGGTWYYLSSSGIMQTGWQKIGGAWYWFDDSGAMASGWRVVDGSYYYFDGSGVMQTGWLSTGGAWYYLSGSGAMTTGWQVIGGAKYHFDASGAMASGWSVIDGSYYYFDGSSAMQTGWLNRGGAWYWLGDSGVMATGWRVIGGAKYFFDDSGAMATGWKWIDGSCYYFDGSGVMQTNKRIDGSYVGSDGRWDQNA